MSIRITLWCRCGGGLTVRAHPGQIAQRIAGSFRSVHVADGCEITEDPALGRKWRAAAQRAEARSR